MASPTRSSNGRASVAVLLGLVAVAAVPAAVLLARRTPGIALIDAAWAIPFAFAAGVGALLCARGAKGAIVRSLERAGGRGRIRAGRILAVAGISVALSAAIAVGFYELLLRLEG
jgi:hypothetical protein